MTPILKLSPRLVPRPWGGARLATLLHKDCDRGDKIGESWELSDHPDGPSAIEGGPHHGRLFGDLVREFPQEMVGQTRAPDRYPLLVKYIDASEDLSIQVHPDDAYAQRAGLGDRGKTECWYILDGPPGGEIIHGLREGARVSDLESALRTGTVEAVVRRVSISPGDFVFVPSGTVHAILAGTLLCEIQQSSNLTFRLWDWNRHPARPLHERQSLDVIRTEPGPPKLSVSQVQSGGPRLTPLTQNRFFQVRHAWVPPRSRLRIPQPGPGLIVNGVFGSCALNGVDLSIGSTCFVPASVPEIEIETREEGAMALLTESREN